MKIIRNNSKFSSHYLFKNSTVLGTYQKCARHIRKPEISGNCFELFKPCLYLFELTYYCSGMTLTRSSKTFVHIENAIEHHFDLILTPTQTLTMIYLRSKKRNNGWKAKFANPSSNLWLRYFPYFNLEQFINRNS